MLQSKLMLVLEILKNLDIKYHDFNLLFRIIFKLNFILSSYIIKFLNKCRFSRKNNNHFQKFKALKYNKNKILEFLDK